MTKNIEMLAALLCEDCPNAIRVSDGACIPHLKEARRLAARGVLCVAALTREQVDGLLREVLDLSDTEAVYGRERDKVWEMLGRAARAAGERPGA